MIRHDKGVVVRFFVVNKIDDSRTFLTAGKISDRDTVLQIVHEDSVFLHKLSVFKIFELVQSVLNGVIGLETLLEPEELLDFLHETESSAGRERTLRWGPRTLDLDILIFDKLVYESDALVIPHVDMENRAFVLEPLSSMAPNYRHPVLGRTVLQLLEDLRR